MEKFENWKILQSKQDLNPLPKYLGQRMGARVKVIIKFPTIIFPYYYNASINPIVLVRESVVKI